MKTINVIGCGSVGKTLARLWTLHDVFRVQSIANRSPASAARAADFVGNGQPVESLAQMQPADIVMISTPDEAIAECCRELCETEVLQQGTVVFHCSGSLPSTLLEPARRRGASIAGVHPIKSFADPTTAVDTFAGTFCAVEGDPHPCEILSDALHRCGAFTFSIAPEAKTIYHAATVIVCNYLVALMEVGLRCFRKAGIPRETAMQAMQPIVTGTVANVFNLGPAEALTGPIGRGEPSVVARQCEALGQWDEDVLQLYKTLGQFAAELSAAQGNAPAEALAEIRRVLQR